MITYVIISYLVMGGMGFLAYTIEPEKVTYKDWLIWLAAPFTAPSFVLYVILKKFNQPNKNH
jgi:hypothetical protein